MKATVLMSSGDIDEWDNVTDAVVSQGSLVVVRDPEEDEQLAELKTLTVRGERPQEPLSDAANAREQLERVRVLHEPPMVQFTTVLVVMAEYAPGMWMKVEYQ